MTPDWNQNFSLRIPDNEDIEKSNFSCIVVDGKGYDTIFQFFNVKSSDFDEVIAEVIEDHFGDTEGFAIEYVDEMDMFGLLAKDLKDNPMFSRDFHIYDFLDLLDSTITELNEA